jgi:hypothetical protein
MKLTSHVVVVGHRTTAGEVDPMHDRVPDRLPWQISNCRVDPSHRIDFRRTLGTHLKGNRNHIGHMGGYLHFNGMSNVQGDRIECGHRYFLRCLHFPLNLRIGQQRSQRRTTINQTRTASKFSGLQQSPHTSLAVSSITSSSL